jgi:hypothetical protein
MRGPVASAAYQQVFLMHGHARRQPSVTVSAITTLAQLTASSRKAESMEPPP